MLARPFICARCTRRLASRSLRQSLRQSTRHISYGVEDIVRSDSRNEFADTLAKAPQPRDPRSSGNKAPRTHRARSHRPTPEDEDSKADLAELYSYFGIEQSKVAGRYSSPRRQETVRAPEAKIREKLSSFRTESIAKAAAAAAAAPHGERAEQATSKRTLEDQELSTHRSSGPVLVNDVIELEKHLEGDDARKAWDFFISKCGSPNQPWKAHPTSFAENEVDMRITLFPRLVIKIIEAWLTRDSSAAESAEIPKPSEVIDRLRDAGVSSRNVRGIALFMLCCGLRGNLYAKNDVSVSQSDVESLHELMYLWSYWLTRPAQSEQQQPDDQSTSSASPSRFDFAPSSAWPAYRGLSKYMPDSEAAILRFIPRFADSGKHKAASAALLTYDILKCWPTEQDALPSELRIYQPFIDSMDRIWRQTKPFNSSLTKWRRQMYKAKVPDSLVDKIMNRFSAGDARESSKPSVSRRTAQETPDMTFEDIVTQLGRAVERQSVDYVEKLWIQAQPLLTAAAAEQDPSQPGALMVYEAFISAFLALKRRESAMQTWQVMTDRKCVPQVKTWTILMRGTSIGSEVELMQVAWQRMRASGVQPDAPAWSTRIMKLFRKRKFPEGFRALDEMSREWTEALSRYRNQQKRLGRAADDESQLTEIQGVPKPNVITLNSALSGLASHGAQHIGQVLSWSRGFDISPDRVTYNVLLNVMMRNDRQDEATKILERMATEGIEPDGSTFTILLNSMLHTSALHEIDGAANQQQRIMGLVGSLGSAMNVKSYSLLMDRLLKEYKNLPAAQNVLEHMLARDIQPNAYIYTILMTHYFQSDPPDLHAAEALWAQITQRRHHAASLDIIFYDRMVEGYARHGVVGPMMTFLTKMSKDGKKPGWEAMTAVIRAFARRGDWDRVREIVLDVQTQGGLLPAGVRGTVGQAEFWTTVGDYEESIGRVGSR